MLLLDQSSATSTFVNAGTGRGRHFASPSDSTERRFGTWCRAITPPAFRGAPCRRSHDAESPVHLVGMHVQNQVPHSHEQLDALAATLDG